MVLGQSTGEFNRRILVTADNESIQQEIQCVLGTSTDEKPLRLNESEFKGEPARAENKNAFEVDSAFGERAGLDRIALARRENRPYAMTIVDLRSSSNRDRIDVIRQILEQDADIQVVICTAKSDFTWSDVRDRIGFTDRLLILKKPFDCCELLQVVAASVHTWNLSRQAQLEVSEMREIARQRAAELVEAERQLELVKRFDEVGRLAGNSAREFSDLLQTMTHFGRKALEELDSNEEVRRDLHEAISAMDRASDLANQLLSLSQIQSGTQIVLDLGEAVRQEIAYLQPLLPETAVVLESCTNGARVNAEPSLIGQVIMNLCKNAGDAMRPGGTVRLSISVEEFPAGHRTSHGILEPGAYVRLDVTDDGCGISVDDCDRIFEPFFTTKEVGHGSGMGLAFVYSVVTQHGGAINVESQVGVGSTISVYLPCYCPAHDLPAEATSETCDVDAADCQSV